MEEKVKKIEKRGGKNEEKKIEKKSDKKWRKKLKKLKNVGEKLREKM